MTYTTNIILTLQFPVTHRLHTQNKHKGEGTDQLLSTRVL